MKREKKRHFATISLTLDSGKNDQLMLDEVAFDEEEDIYIVWITFSRDTS